MNSALITGGAGATGGAIAARLLTEGWRVLLVDSDEDGLQRAKTQLAAAERLETQSLDVTRLDAFRDLVRNHVAKHGPFTGLVNAAGGRFGAACGRFTESDPEAWRPIIDLQLRSVIGCCHCVLPSMFEAEAGSVVSVVAFEALRGAPGSAVFSAAKAGVVVLTQTLAAECQKYGVRVNAVLAPPPESLSRNSIVDPVVALAEAVAFLLSDRSRLTTGACLDASGGWALH